jgi:hypothetical protein
MFKIWYKRYATGTYTITILLNFSQDTRRFIKTLPISSTYISNAALNIMSQVSYMTGSFRFPGKAVILLSAADWRCIRELNEIRNGNTSSPYEAPCILVWLIEDKLELSKN